MAFFPWKSSTMGIYRYPFRLCIAAITKSSSLFGLTIFRSICLFIPIDLRMNNISINRSNCKKQKCNTSGATATTSESTVNNNRDAPIITMVYLEICKGNKRRQYDYDVREIKAIGEPNMDELLCFLGVILVTQQMDIEVSINAISWTNFSIPIPNTSEDNRITIFIPDLPTGI